MALLPCPKCGLASVIEADGVERPCASCGAPLRVDPPVEPEVPALTTAFRYPFSSGSSLMLLASAAPLWGTVRALSFSLIGGLGEVVIGMGGIFLGIVLLALFGGFLAVWLWEILETTAQGRDVPPPAPWPGEFWEFFRPFVRFVVAFSTAFLPAMVVRWTLGTEEWRGALGAGLALAGMLYYPMAMLLVGFSGSWTGAFWFPTALRSMRILGRDYALCCTLIAVSFGLSTVVEVGASAVWTRVGPGAGLAASTVAVFLELALYAIHMRAIGLVYRAHRKELGWFR